MEEASGFLQFFSHDKRADVKAQFSFKFLGKGASLNAYVIGNLFNGDVLVDMIRDVFDSLVDVQGHT